MPSSRPTNSSSRARRGYAVARRRQWSKRAELPPLCARCRDLGSRSRWQLRRAQIRIDRAAAAAPEIRRLPARMDLARLYLAHDMAAEAKAVLDLALAANPPSAEDSTPLVLHAIACILAGPRSRRSRTSTIRSSATSTVRRCGGPVALARLSKWADAREGFRNVEAAMAPLPLETAADHHDGDDARLRGGRRYHRRRETSCTNSRPSASRASLSRRCRCSRPESPKGSGGRATRCGPIGPRRIPGIAGPRRRAVCARSCSARQSAISCAPMPSATLKRSRRSGAATRPRSSPAIAHAPLCRGRSLRDAFHVARTAVKAHPKFRAHAPYPGRGCGDFDNLFLGARGDAMPTVDALALFYDYRELTPIGRAAIENDPAPRRPAGFGRSARPGRGAVAAPGRPSPAGRRAPRRSRPAWP